MHVDSSWLAVCLPCAPNFEAAGDHGATVCCLSALPPTHAQDLTFRHYIMKLKVTQETYNDEQKLRTSVVSVAPPNFAQESKVRAAYLTRAVGRGVDGPLLKSCCAQSSSGWGLLL